MIVSLIKQQKDEDDIEIIAKYLSNTNLLNKFERDSINKNTSNLKYFCAFALQYKYLNPNEVLFRIGDVGDKFYIILKGKVGIFKTKVYNKDLSFKDFLIRIRQLKESEDFFILDRIIEDNKELIHYYYDKYIEEENKYQEKIIVEEKETINSNSKNKHRSSLTYHQDIESLNGKQSNKSLLKMSIRQNKKSLEFNLIDVISKEQKPIKKHYLDYFTNIASRKNVSNKKLVIKETKFNTNTNINTLNNTNNLEKNSSDLNNIQRKSYRVEFDSSPTNKKGILVSKKQITPKNHLSMILFPSEVDFDKIKPKRYKSEFKIPIKDLITESKTKTKQIEKENNKKENKKLLFNSNNANSVRSNITDDLSIASSNQSKVNNSNYSPTNFVRQKTHGYLKQNKTYLKLKYNYIDQVLENFVHMKSNFKIHEYYKHLELGTGQYFGDFALESDEKRSATIKSLDKEVHLGVIDSSFYLSYIKNEKHKAMALELNTFMERYFFSHIKKTKFENLYTILFNKVTYRCDETIISDMTPLTHLYFLKNQPVELVNNKTIPELCDVIDELLYLVNLNKPGNINLNKKYLLENFSEYKEYNEKKLKLSMFNLSNETLNKYKPKKILITEGYYIFNLYEYYLGKKSSFFNLIPVYNNTEIYKISIKDFETILTNEQLTHTKMKDYISITILPLILRLCNSINYQINKYNYEDKQSETLLYEKNKIIAENELISGSSANKTINFVIDTSLLIHTDPNYKIEGVGGYYSPEKFGKKRKGYYNKLKLFFGNRHSALKLSTNTPVKESIYSIASIFNPTYNVSTQKQSMDFQPVNLKAIISSKNIISFKNKITPKTSTTLLVTSTPKKAESSKLNNFSSFYIHNKNKSSYEQESKKTNTIINTIIHETDKDNKVKFKDIGNNTSAKMINNEMTYNSNQENIMALKLQQFKNTSLSKYARSIEKTQSTIQTINNLKKTTILRRKTKNVLLTEII